ncbi:hypothetical protein AB0F49_00180 [Micromonospora ureilytica]|uniref:hypothetical protein n=1 Tax=Micromonospora ureilytica TaxID=709868 RepID=UPI0033C93584
MTAMDALSVELDDGHQRLRAGLMDQMRRFGASAELVEYVGGLRLYLRAAYLLTVWLPEIEQRRRIAGHIAQHIVAMKLFDDLLDDDSGFERFELALGLLLEQQSIARLAELAEDANVVLGTVEESFVTIGTGQLRTKREPATDIASWRTHASTYGACFLGLYGDLAALAGRVPEAIRPAREFGQGFGMLVTIADDLRDYERHGERIGNLGHLLLTGRVSVEELRDLVEEMREFAYPTPEVATVHDLRPIVDLYADDVLNRGLPLLFATAKRDGVVHA